MAGYSPEGPGSHIQSLKTILATGIPGFHHAPCIILIIEPGRFPPVEEEFLAFVIAHLWIHAVLHGLGLHLIQGISYRSRKPDFFPELGLIPGKYAVRGVAIGYPHEDLSTKGKFPGRMV